MSRPVPLPAIHTPDSATAALPDFAEAGVERIIDLVLDAPDWTVRLAMLDAFLTGEPVASRFAAEAQSRLITAMLEPLGERDITALEAALAYRLTIHREWRDAAKRYLDAVPDDIIPMLEAHPGVGVFVCGFLALEPQL